MRLPDRIVLLVAAFGGAMTLGACSTHAQEPVRAGPAVNGPAADYPVVIGEPFEVDGVRYTPSDTMNYDGVGYVASDDPGVAGVTAAHRTLPLPSYVEVTALDSGKTILARVERRGPMTNERLLALSPMALAQLGVVDGAPIRIRRVNPPEAHRAKLRAGEEALPRMDTPEGLLVVLRRLLPEGGSASLSDPRQQQVSGREPGDIAIVTIDPTPPPALEPASPAAEIVEQVEDPRPEPEDAPATQPVAAEGKFVVQLGAFSVRANAERLAEKIGGFLVESGRFTIVRAGPYSSRGQAGDALAKFRAQGYSDAQIRTLD